MCWMLPLQIIFFGENEYLEWKKKRPHSQFNKKKPTQRGNWNFTRAFKMTCASSHGFILATTSLQFCQKHIGVNRNLKVDLCEVTWKRVTLQMLPMVTLSRKWHNIKHPSDIFNLSIWLVSVICLCFSKCHIEWVGANWSYKVLQTSSNFGTMPTQISQLNALD